MTQLGVNCFHSGIPEEETVKRTIFHYYLRRQEMLVRQLVKNVYNEQEGFGKKNSLGKEQFLALQTEEFMKRRMNSATTRRWEKWNTGSGTHSVFTSTLSTNGY